MLNFDTKKKLLKKLRESSEKNILMVIPCVIASWFVRLFYFIACNIDIALSDKNGNFLGIKHKDKAEKRAKKDDIVYVKRPFMGRVVSAVLSAAFILTFMPVLDMDIFAAEGDYYEYPEGSGYYYKESLDVANPIIIESACIAGDGAFKLSWRDGGKSGTSLETDTDGFYVYYQSEEGTELAYNGGKMISVDKNGTGEYSAIITGQDNNTTLSPEKYYSFSVRARKDVYRYKKVEDASNPGIYKYEYVDVQTLYSDAVYLENPRLRKPFDYIRLSPEITVDYYKQGETGANTPERVEIRLDKGTPGATGYLLYRTDLDASNPKEVLIGQYYPVDRYPDGTLLATLQSTSSHTLTDTTRYSYRLVAYKNVFENTNDGSYDSRKDSYFIKSLSQTPSLIHTKTAVPDNFTASGDEVSVTLKWKTVKNADGYYIYRLTNDENNQYMAGTLDITDYLIRKAGSTDTSYKDTEIDNLQKYWYYIAAYRDYSSADGSGGEEVSQYASLSYTLNTAISDPQSVVAEPDDGKVTLTWKCSDKTVKGFDIRITQLEDENGNDLALRDADGNFILDENGDKTYRYEDVEVAASPMEYEHTGLYNNTKYRYEIRAFKVINGQKQPVSSYTRPVTATVGLPIYPPHELNTAPGNGQINVSWSEVKGAQGYYLYISKVNDDGTSELLPNMPIFCQDTSFLHRGLKNGEKYSYYVVAYKEVTGVKDYSEPTSPPREETVGLPFGSPSDFSAVSEDGQVELKWSAVSGAEWYVVYANGGDPDNPQSLTFKTEKTSYIHKGLINGQQWSYYVVPYKDCPSIDGDDTAGEPSQTKNVTVGIPLMSPPDLTAAPDDGTITLKWSSVKGAERYYIEAVNVTTGEKEYFNTTKTTFQHTELTNGHVWKYYVKAYKMVRSEDGTTSDVYSDPAETSATVGVYLLKPSDMTAAPGDSEIELSWSAVKGADGYTLYASDGFNNLTFDVTKTKFTHSGLNAGVVWTYYVVPYKTVSGQKVTGPQSEKVSASVSSYLNTPKDFTVSSVDASAALKWSAVKGAEGYVVTAYKSGSSYDFDVSKTAYTHTGLVNGDTWNYYVRAYRTVNGVKVYSDPTITLSVRIGASLGAPIDLTATSGNRQIDLSWSAVKGAEGYVVYLYDEGSASFLPLSVVSKTKFSHTGLNNGQKYTYMVAAYKTISGERVYGDYSMAVDAIPSAGSAADLDTVINIKGTAPYGISHSELISAAANHEAFDEAVDCYFSTNEESTNAIKEVLRHYANGLSSFIVYPFDISLYLADTLISVEPNPGFSITFTMPIPDKLVQYRDYITVVHLPTDGTEIINDRDYDNEDGIFIDAADLEVLPSAVIQLNGRWCIQFSSDSVSPFALVIYKDAIDDVSSSASAAGGSFAGNFDTGVLLFTALPDIMPAERKTRFVVSAKKYYRIKR